MKIGNYTLHAVETGRFALDGGAMFGIIPKPLWQKTNPADALNRIELSARSLLLVSDKRKILIDTGMGEKWDEKSKEIYNIDSGVPPIETSLAAFGLTASDITDVLLTHLHFDHTGGSVKFNDGRLMPAFENARYYIQEDNFRWGMNPSGRDRGSYIKDNFEQLAKEGVLIFVGSDVELIDDCIEVIPVHGHTYGQQLFRIFDDANSVLYCGDLFPTSAHIPLPYIMGYDLQPLITLQEKESLLPKAVDGDWALFFEHDAFNQAATVTATPKGFAVKEFVNAF